MELYTKTMNTTRATLIALLAILAVARTTTTHVMPGGYRPEAITISK